MSALGKVIRTLLVGHNVVLTFIVVAATLALFFGGLTTGPMWFVFIAPFTGWLGWSLIREDWEDIRAIWGSSDVDGAR